MTQTFDLKQALKDTGNQPEYKDKVFTGYEFMNFLARVRGLYAQSLSPDFSTNDLRDMVIEQNWIYIDRSPGRLSVRLALPQ